MRVKWRDMSSAEAHQPAAAVHRRAPKALPFRFPSVGPVSRAPQAVPPIPDLLPAAPPHGREGKCGVCSPTVKSTAFFTAECGHAFHLPCITTFVQASLRSHSFSCPVCSFTWPHSPFLSSLQFQPAINPPSSQSVEGYAREVP